MAGINNIVEHRTRSLTKLLIEAGRRTASGLDVPRNVALAENVWELVTKGVVEFPGGKKIELTAARDMIDLYRWLFAHIDGPPPITGTMEPGEGGKITVTFVGAARHGDNDTLEPPAETSRVVEGRWIAGSNKGDKSNPD